MIFIKTGTDVKKTPKVKKTSSLGIKIAPPLPYFTPQNSHFGPRDPEYSCKY